MPTLAACRALTSAPGSNGAFWTRMAMWLTSRYGGEKGDFVTGADGLVEAAQLLIARAHEVRLGQHLPHPATGQELLTQRVEAGETATQLLGIDAQGFAITGEILHMNHASPPS